MTSGLSKLLWLFLCAFIVGLLTLLIVVVRACSSTGGDVPLFATNRWATYDAEEIDRELKRHPGQPYTPTPRPYADPLGVVLRRETEGGGALLLKHPDRQTVYRYDPAGGSLTEVTDAEWERASGTVAACGKQATATEQARINPQSGRLFAGGREVMTKGRKALSLAIAPSGKRLAVLSADGPTRPSLMPFGGEGVLGQRYYQSVTLPDASAVSKPLRVPVRNATDTPVACWSDDEQYVVYLDPGLAYLSVIATNLSTVRH